MGLCDAAGFGAMVGRIAPCGFVRCGRFWRNGGAHCALRVCAMRQVLAQWWGALRPTGLCDVADFGAMVGRIAPYGSAMSSIGSDAQLAG
jgi:hypothetical protein